MRKIAIHLYSGLQLGKVHQRNNEPQMDTDGHRWTRDLSVLHLIELRYKLDNLGQCLKMQVLLIPSSFVLDAQVLVLNNRIPFAVTSREVPVSAKTATANPTNPKVPNSRNKPFVTREKTTFC
jgi:hypothetical protein